MSNRPTFAEIDLSRLTVNFDRVRAISTESTILIPVVKADAYGHGSVECSVELERHGASMFAVSLPEEGIKLRTGGIRSPILVMGGSWPGQESDLTKFDLTPVVSDIDTIERLAASGFVGNIHLKIDTGMGRAGFRWDETISIAESLSRVEGISVAGAMTHFSSADDRSADDFTLLQIERFRSALDVLGRYGIDPPLIHCSNSPAAIRKLDMAADAVRIGGGLYGLLDDIIPSEPFTGTLESVMTLKSRVSLIKRLMPGESVGYNCTFTAANEMLTAIIPIGYADGLPRALSGSGRFLIRGQNAAILGRVSMDWTVVDVTNIPNVSVGDDVVIFGGRGSGAMTASEIGSICGTIGYEITCGISNRVPRVFVNG